MTLQERLTEDLKQSMRSGDAPRRSVLRLLRAAIQSQEKDSQTSLDDEGVTAVLMRQAKQRRDSIAAFEDGGRQDLVDKEKAELDVIFEYLPQQMSEDEIESVARTAIKELSARGPQDMGRVMGRLVPHLRDKADGRAISTVVSRLLKDMAEFDMSHEDE